MSRLEPPKTLELRGNLSENWRRFKQDWECYLTVVLDGRDKPDEYKSSLLLHVIGEDARELYNSFEWADPADRVNIDAIVEKLEQYCVPRKNITFERYKFFTCAQKQGQTVDQYVNDLQQKAKSCEFGNLKDSLVRDRIVCGIYANDIREKLLRDDRLTLARAIETCRAFEIANSQAKELGEDCSVHFVRSKGKQKRQNQNSQFQKNSKHDSCGRCGKKHTIEQKCPAYGKKCMKCGRIGHFAVVCRSSTSQSSKKKNVHELEADHGESASFTSQRDTDFFIDVIESQLPQGRSTGAWVVPLNVNQSDIHLKLDTGANINIMTVSQWKSLRDPVQLQPTNVKLTAYGGGKVVVHGQIDVTVKLRGEVYKTTFVVTPEKVEGILGIQDCERFNLVHKVYEMTADINQVPKAQNNDPDIMTAYEDVFNGLGCLPGTHTIKINPKATPVIEGCRKVPFALHDQLKKELDRMKSLDVITEVTEPTEWVNSMVIVHKKQGTLRICLDPRNLNLAVRREHFKLPTREEVMAQFAGATVFSKLDASSGFWQLKLDHASSLLTTFNTPFGRFRYLRLPFGISSAPEVYHRTIHQLFEDIKGVDTSMDDVIIWGENNEQHDQRLRLVLDKCREVGLKLNRAKCELKVPELTFLGDRVTKEGLKPDPLKVKAIIDLEKPTEKKELQRFMGMVNYLGRYIPDLSTISAPLRQLLEKNVHWTWSHEHDRAWKDLKTLISQQPVLQYYDQKKPIKLSSDASQKGLGAVLLQLHGDTWRPVAYASRALTQAETRYAQIEKEALGICFGTERFHQYLYGRTFEAETDHKPLVPILKKALNDCPPRIQRFRLRLQKYDITLSYTPGKEMYTADALSRNFPRQDEPVSTTEADVQVCVDGVLSTIQVSSDRLEQIKVETNSDPEMKQLVATILSGWPNERTQCPSQLVDYWNYRDELSVINGIVFKCSRVVVPRKLRNDMLHKIHVGHLGQEKCKHRAREVIFWPRMNQDIDILVSGCESCTTYRNRQRTEPLLPHPTASRPWQKVSTDLFEFDKKDYIVVVDCYSSYPEVIALPNQTSQAVIRALKSTFSRHGIPAEVFSDNGPCYSCSEFDQFSKDWQFTHSTSSPRFPQSNGLAERTVQTVKNIMKKCKESGDDPHLGLLAYRSTPLDNGLSPSQMLMGRRLQSNLPVKETLLQSESTPTNVSYRMLSKETQKKYFDDRTQRKTLPLLEPGNVVRVHRDNPSDWRIKGEVIEKVAPRSYLVKTDAGGLLRRNRRDLLLTKKTDKTVSVTPDIITEVSSPPVPSTAASGVDNNVNNSSSTSSGSSNKSSGSSSTSSGSRAAVPLATRSGREVRRPNRLIEAD